MVGVLERGGSDLDGLIVECGFEAGSSCWGIRRVRSSKTVPNALRTGWSTLESLVENITEEDLVRRLGGGGGGGGEKKP